MTHVKKKSKKKGVRFHRSKEKNIIFEAKLLSEYLDKHNTEEIAADLKEAFSKTVDQTKEKVADVREDVEQQVEKMKADYKEAKESGKIDEQINEVKENLRDGADKAKEMVDKGRVLIEEQLKDLRSRLGL